MDRTSTLNVAHRGSSPHRPSTPLAAMRAFQVLAAPLRLRVIRDREDWPVIPGRLGRIEWHDAGTLSAFTDRPRVGARLWAIPGVRRWQTGDREVRGLFPMEALPAVAGLIHARRRRAGRPLTTEQALELRVGARVRGTSALQELA